MKIQCVGVEVEIAWWWWLVEVVMVAEVAKLEEVCNLLERVCRAVMTMRGSSVARNTPITTTSIRVVLCASR